MLNKDRRLVPLYYQVAHLLRERVRRGEYPVGSQIPSEIELSKEMGVSRVTVREALRSLAQDNTLMKIHGKGTFVAANPSSNSPAVKFAGSLDDLYDRVQTATVKHVQISRVPVTDELRNILQLNESETEVVRIKRVRFLDEGPYAFHINYLPVETGSRIREDQLYNVPLLRILEDELQIPVTGAQETIEASLADAETANHLEVAVMSAVMQIKRVIFTLGNRPLETVESFFRADKFQYPVNLIRVRHNGKQIWAFNAGLRP
ncbi:MAG: GntR family transcriptional regulator [Acidobacteria bacterium]|nr:GntR family transcriptional regulator [Acidobacteriota bacterium]